MYVPKGKSISKTSDGNLVNIRKVVQTSKRKVIFISHYTNPRFPLSAPQEWWPTLVDVQLGSTSQGGI